MRSLGATRRLARPTHVKHETRRAPPRSVCRGYNDDGTVCLQPGMFVHPNGYYACAAHRPPPPAPLAGTTIVPLSEQLRRLREADRAGAQEVNHAGS